MAWPPAARTASTWSTPDDVVTGGQWPVVDELLLAVDDPAVVDPGLWVANELAVALQ